MLENVMERFIVQVFLDGLRDYETTYVWILSRSGKLVNALVLVLDFEVANNQVEARYYLEDYKIVLKSLLSSKLL